MGRGMRIVPSPDHLHGNGRCVSQRPEDDPVALRRVQARFYGVFMSINPVFAALTGLVVLGEALQPTEWLAIAAIVTANAVCLTLAGGHARPAGLVPGVR